MRSVCHGNLDHPDRSAVWAGRAVEHVEMVAVDFDRAKNRSVRALAYVGVPMSVVLYANSTFIVSAIFARGAFNAESVAITSQILASMAAGVWGHLLGYAGAKFLTARGQNAEALFASVAAVACSVAVLLTGQALLGAAVLGVAAAAHGIIFGCIVVWRLKPDGALVLELGSLGALALLHAIFIDPMIQAVSLNGLPHLLVSALFWVLALVGLPWHRQTLIPMLSALSELQRR